MRRLPPALVAASALAVLAPALPASEEEFLPPRSVRVEYGERSQTGKVAVTASQGAGGITAIEVTAFGKAHTAGAADLAKLAGYGLEGMRATHEAGYENLGGNTVHIRLRRPAGAAAGGKTAEEAIVSVSKGRGLSVTLPKKGP